jgi:hypothetical protein
MNKKTVGVLAGVGIVVGYLTLRRVRRRRSAMDEAEAAADIAIEETESAADHAVAAAGHAKRAGEMAVDAARGEPDDPEANGETAPARSNRRLRRVGKGWLRQ